MQWSDGKISPPIFRLWAAISTLACASERRLWVKSQEYTTFLNLYIMLVAPSGIGKIIIDDVKSILIEAVEPGSKIPAFKVAPDSVTKASLIDELEKRKTHKVTPSGPPLVYSSVQMIYEELSQAVPIFDREFINFLVGVWNNKSMFRETRRMTKSDITIQAPQLNLLAGAQPAYLANTFPEDTWRTGIGRRILMIYHGVPTKINWFAKIEEKGEQRQLLLSRLSQLSSVMGEMGWNPDALEKFVYWYEGNCPPLPTHSKLQDYNNGRAQTIIKLAGISVISRTGTVNLIELEDLDRAFKWLFEAERLMPDIFRAMIGKSDNSILEELLLVMRNYEAKNRVNGRAKNIKGELIWQFLSDRVPGERITYLIQAAEKSGMIQRIAGTEDLFMVNPTFMRIHE